MVLYKLPNHQNAATHINGKSLIYHTARYLLNGVKPFHITLCSIIHKHIHPSKLFHNCRINILYSTLISDVTLQYKIVSIHLL